MIRNNTNSPKIISMISDKPILNPATINEVVYIKGKVVLILIKAAKV